MDVSKYGEAPIGLDHDLNQLAGFVEQRLDPAERAAVVQHLATCAECREVVAGLTREGVGDRRSEDQPGLHPARTGLHAAKRRALRTTVWLPIAASIVLVIGASWFAAGRLLAPVNEPEPPPAPSTTPSPPPSPAVVTPKPPPADPGTTVRSGAEREVGGRRFKLEAGTWIDTGYDPFALLPVVNVKTAAERDALLAKNPALKPFLDLGPRVTVVHQGAVYRFDLPR